ncbi:FluC/FEX family fluoride channel [Streptomyces sp. PA5.6]|uniref:FluC/FEX family fluoride channel n=1 Tax=Streptomyces sp. PA5.6 TaxID=3035651 RepID=UPI003904C041
MRPPGRRRVGGTLTRDEGKVVAAVAAGGAMGAVSRYALSLGWPTAPDGFPWTTLVVNAAGCAAIGVLMVLVTEVRQETHPLVRPFLGTGFLGGFTTFSTYAVDIERLVRGGHPRTGLAYLALTLIAALAAVWGAAWTTRRVAARRTAAGSRP